MIQRAHATSTAIRSERASTPSAGSSCSSDSLQGARAVTDPDLSDRILASAYTPTR